MLYICKFFEPELEPVSCNFHSFRLIKSCFPPSNEIISKFFSCFKKPTIDAITSASKKRCSTNACASQLLALLGGHALATDCLKKLANLELFSTPVYGNEVQNPVMIAGSSTSKSSSVPNVILRS